MDPAVLCYIAGKLEWPTILALRCVCKYFGNVNTSILKAAQMINNYPIPFLPHITMLSFLRQPKIVIGEWNIWRKFIAIMTSNPHFNLSLWWKRMSLYFSFSLSRVASLLVGNQTYFALFKALNERASTQLNIIHINELQKVEDTIITATCFSLFRDLEEKKSATMTITRDTFNHWGSISSGIEEYIANHLSRGNQYVVTTSPSKESMMVIGEGVEVEIHFETQSPRNALLQCSLEVEYNLHHKNKDFTITLQLLSGPHLHKMYSCNTRLLK